MKLLLELSADRRGPSEWIREAHKSVILNGTPDEVVETIKDLYQDLGLFHTSSEEPSEAGSDDEEDDTEGRRLQDLHTAPPFPIPNEP